MSLLLTGLAFIYRVAYFGTVSGMQARHPVTELQQIEIAPQDVELELGVDCLGRISPQHRLQVRIGKRCPKALGETGFSSTIDDQAAHEY